MSWGTTMWIAGEIAGRSFTRSTGKLIRPGDLSARRQARFSVRAAPTLSKRPMILSSQGCEHGHRSGTATEIYPDYDYVSGDFIWTGIDYLGETRWPAKIASSGALDTCGFPKDAYYFYQSRWTTETGASSFPHWNWAGREGKVITVTCYTNCDTVELFLNGKSFGVKGYAFPRPGMVGTYGKYPERAKAVQTTADLHLSWDVPFTAGTLTAKGVKDGKVIRTVEVETTGSPAKLGLTVDRPRISREPSDVAHVTVKVLDQEGRVVPTANDEITFAVAGAGRILGVDNGQPDSHEATRGPPEEPSMDWPWWWCRGPEFRARSLCLLHVRHYLRHRLISKSARLVWPSRQHY